MGDVVRKFSSTKIQNNLNLPKLTLYYINTDNWDMHLMSQTKVYHFILQNQVDYV